LSLKEIVALGVVGSLVLWVEEARKVLVRRRDRRLYRSSNAMVPSAVMCVRGEVNHSLEGGR
jgi:hypothetical protein